jgi:hypothetical protein
MGIINQPPTSAVDDSNAVDANKSPVNSAVNQEWRNFFGSVYNVCLAVTSSSTTANRPTKFLWTGRPHFDTTIGKPIWYKTAGWVDATGAPV